VITEHGVKFKVAPGTKHKTGFFADQRDNRKRLAEYARGKTVLDLCCNSGGFALYAKVLGEATEVVGVDLDEEILGRRRAEREAQQGQGPLRAGRPVRRGCATSRSEQAAVRRRWSSIPPR
jgi:23S rRNA (cytosine1962-C5)-methyltransferase